MRAGADNRRSRIRTTPAGESISDGILAHRESGILATLLHHARALRSVGVKTMRVTAGSFGIRE